MKNNDQEILNSKQKVLNKLGLDAEKELSNENVFRKFISMDAVVDKEILKMILPNIDNFSELVVKQQEFIVEMADTQRFIDEKALEGFNKTKEIISEVIKANPTMDTELMIYLIDTLKELDKYISDHAKDAGNRNDRLINIGIGVGTVVAGTVLAIVFKGGGRGGNSA